VLDERASTGRLTMAPPPSHTVTIATTPETITVTKLLRLPPVRPEREAWTYGTESPPPEIYRMDGAEIAVYDPRDARRERRYSFRLVADALALTIKETSQSSGGAFTVVTDAYWVEGDVLTIHRQLSSVNASGHIATMQEPTNNSRHTFIYRRGPVRTAQ
jgi:hypothetical protein